MHTFVHLEGTPPSPLKPLVVRPGISRPDGRWAKSGSVCCQLRLSFRRSQFGIGGRGGRHAFNNTVCQPESRGSFLSLRAASRSCGVIARLRVRTEDFRRARNALERASRTKIDRAIRYTWKTVRATAGERRHDRLRLPLQGVRSLYFNDHASACLIKSARERVGWKRHGTSFPILRDVF